jgi:hypothetical protein
MKRPVSAATRRELRAAVAVRYREADRQGKKAILDEFVKVTGYHRKHAIRLLSGEQAGKPEGTVGRRIRDAAVEEALVVLWEASDRICGKRLKALLPTLVEAMERHGHLRLEAGVRETLLRLSAATIDRRLRPLRARAAGARRPGRKLNRVRKLVAVKTFADWEAAAPGWMEVDLVTHSGPRAVGSFVHTLVLTDVASGWTECLALPVREQALIVEAVTAMAARLPFPLRGLDTDNDSAFMNDTLWDYCQRRGLELTRSRAYRKNDQAWVEQKNGAVVRKLVGYGRLEGLAATAALRRLYEASRLYVNFFQPSFKLKDKERVGAKVRKRYDPPQSPYGRLLGRDEVAASAKRKLEEQFRRLDPVLLLKHIRDAQAAVIGLSHNVTPPPLSEDLQQFVRSLATAWSDGEVRPTHRRAPRPGRWWRTRTDPFAEVWPVLLRWLEERPDLEATEMLKRLQASGYGEYPGGQLRTLQRRVREWRIRIARELVYGPDGADTALVTRTEEQSLA